MVDLWPEHIEQTEITAPAFILKEQASLLGRKTQMIVKAEVEPGDPSHHEGMRYFDKEDYRKFIYDFYIVGPLLDNYRYLLFGIMYNIDLYPVEFILEPEIEEDVVGENVHLLIAKSESEFIKMLGLILKSKKTIKVR